MANSMAFVCKTMGYCEFAVGAYQNICTHYRIQHTIQGFGKEMVFSPVTDLEDKLSQTNLSTEENLPKSSKISFQNRKQEDNSSNLRKLNLGDTSPISENIDNINERIVQRATSEGKDLVEYCETDIHKTVDVLRNDNEMKGLLRVQGHQKRVMAPGICRRECSKDEKEVQIPPLLHVERSISQWYTIDTLRFTKGDDFVRDVLRENNCSVSGVVAAVGGNDFENGRVSHQFRERYIQLCRRLHLQDLEVRINILLFKSIDHIAIKFT